MGIGIIRFRKIPYLRFPMEQQKTVFSPGFSGTCIAILMVCGLPALYGQSGPVSITPNVGTGSAQTFKLVYSDPLGTSDLITIQAVFTNNSPQPCYFDYDFSAQQIKLNSNSGGWISAPITSPQILSNNQCTVNGPGISVSTSGNYLTLTLPLSFQPVFAGLKQVWMQASSS